MSPAELIIAHKITRAPNEEGTVADNPLWAQLPAVRSGALVEVDQDVWYQDTALTRMARLDDIERIARDLT